MSKKTITHGKHKKKNEMKQNEANKMKPQNEANKKKERKNKIK